MSAAEKILNQAQSVEFTTKFTPRSCFNYARRKRVILAWRTFFDGQSCNDCMNIIKRSAAGFQLNGTPISTNFAAAFLAHGIAQVQA